VTILITTWLESSRRYLDLCVESVRRLNYDHSKLEILIVGRKSYKPYYPKVETIAPDSDSFYPAHAINFGFKKASKDSEFIFILNDDVILTKDCLSKLLAQVSNNKCLANPISPCDNGYGYHLLFGVEKDGQFHFLSKNQYRLEELKGQVEEMMNAQSLYPPGIIMQRFLCIYATLIPRSCFEEVGEWDENFKIGQDDLDYSLRAQAKGYQTISVLDALAWHFGGVSVESSLNQEMRKDNVRYFIKKWGFAPPGLPQSFLDTL
jgi:GT2 family glycosyltransferase